MKIVQFSPSERVDLPDMTAMSWLPFGEYRRLIRTLIAGGSTSSPNLGRIVKGFKVEQSGTSIEVKFDINGDGSDLSVAVGGHEFIGSDGGFFIDQGQLIGDKGIENEQESGGAATRTIDFTGDPNNVYTVEMRFTLTPAESGNRAFWDPSSNEEFIDNVETRYVPGWEIRRVAAPSSSGDDWIPLANVTWSGSVIVLISDIRNFALEGVFPWRVTDQSIDDFGIGDFDRSLDRGDPDVGQNSLWGAIRALERQIMDLKGQDDNGNFNWWARVFPPGPASGAINAKQTKSLRTLDSITFKIGNGTNDWGDFNGSSGLENCLTYIQANRASLPKRIKILLRSRDIYTSYSTVFNITSPHTLSSVNLEIIGDADLPLSRAAISVDLGGSGTAITLTGGLKLYNVSIDIDNPGENGIDVSGSTSNGADIQIDNCQFSAPVGTTTFALKCPSDNLKMINTSVTGGVLHIGGSGSPGSVADESIATLGGQVDNCSFLNAGLILRRNTLTASTSQATVNTQLAHNLTISNSGFDFGSSTTITNGAYISGWGCRGLTFNNCDFKYDGDNNCMQLGACATTTLDLPGLNNKILHSRFYQHSATHTLDIIGVGLGVMISNETVVPTQYDDVPKNFLIDNCRFVGEDGGTSSDGFGIWASNCGNVKVRSCSFEAGAQDSGVALANLVCVYFSNTNPILSLIGAGLDNTVENCQFGPHRSFGSAQTHFPITILYQTNTVIRGNNIYNTAYDLSTPDAGLHNYSGIIFNSSSGIISENTIGYFLEPNNQFTYGTGIWGVEGGNTQISNNRFIDCGGVVIDYGSTSFFSVVGVNIVNNYFYYSKIGYSLVNTLLAMISFTGLASGVNTYSNNYIGNRWNINADDGISGLAITAISFGNDANPMFVGNCFPYGMLLGDDLNQTPIGGNGTEWGGIGRNKSGDNGAVYFEIGPTGDKQTPAFNVFSYLPAIPDDP